MAKGFKVIGASEQDYAFFKEFARKLSEKEGFELKITQALRKAVIQYEVKNGMSK